MIVSKLQGGLGNQLFQWAYIRSLSRNYEAYLDKSIYTYNFYRKYALDQFPNLFAPLLDRDFRGFQRIGDDLIYRKIEFDPDCNYYLDGYWQSEKYFLECSDLIKSELSPPNLFLDGYLPKFSINVSIHIRRTDYINSNGYHPVQPIEYYQKALDIINEYDNVVIFSDDITWCRENLKFKNMIFVDDLTDVENLWLMSTCDHNIIANSSFSWWGAWLNTNNDKKVICPVKWFGDQTNLDSRDITPDSWIRI